MKKLVLLTLSLVTLSCASSQKAAQVEADPYLWLEEVEGEKSLAWVKEQNKESESRLTNHASYKSIEKDFRKILLAKDRLPFVSYSKGNVYNFWQDDNNVRGVWRRAKLADYKKAIVKWETVLDVDQLAKSEKENWVWKGVSCLQPEERRCLISLSRGGKDAVVIREFDLHKREFVKNGFVIPEAKSDIAWIGDDIVFVASDFGPGTMTKAGYPKQVKSWRRGTPLSSAKLILDIPEDHLAVGGVVYNEPEGKWPIISQAIDFYNNKTFVYGLNNRIVPLSIPSDSFVRGVFANRILFSTKSDLEQNGQKFAAGSLLALDLTKPDSNYEVVFSPTDKLFLSEVNFTRHSVLLGVMENVQEKILKATFKNSTWKTEQLVDSSRENFSKGNLSVYSSDRLEEVFIARHEDFLSPPSVVIGEDQGARLYLYKAKSSPERFNSENLVSEQFEARSNDGTKVPYFVIRPKNAKFDGKNPTVLYGYGGFLVSLNSYYLNATGKVWLEKNNGVYVVANIRGGGEFGPKWHEAALKTNRQKAFDDFAAVAEDLIKRKITAANKLAIMGGSNGGLLVGATMVQRPELFKAVVCQVPLLDMLRYHQLLAGHSWIAEYGSPDVPEEREALLRYSPYQNLHPNKSYPMTLFATSTKDDRVHPGHARKMFARMKEFGKPALYWENTEGGHAGAANLEQRIKMSAIQWTFLVDQLVKK